MSKVSMYSIPAAPGYPAASDFVVVFDIAECDLKLARLTSSFDAPFDTPQELSEFSIHELTLLNTSIKVFMKSEYGPQWKKSMLNTISTMIAYHLSSQISNRLTALDKRSQQHE